MIDAKLGKTRERRKAMSKKTKEAKAVVESKPAPAEAKAESKKPVTKPAEKVARNRFGHGEGTQSHLIDSLLQRGATLDDIVAKAKTSRGRVRSHINHLRTSHKQTISEKDGVFRLVEPKKGKEVGE
jgi:hypothetical protein